MSKLPIFEHFLSVGNLKPKLKWFFKPKLKLTIFLLNRAQKKLEPWNRNPAPGAARTLFGYSGDPVYNATTSNLYASSSPYSPYRGYQGWNVTADLTFDLAINILLKNPKDQKLRITSSWTGTGFNGATKSNIWV